MDYRILSRVLGTLGETGCHVPTIASLANVDADIAIAALRELTHRGLAGLRGSAYSLPAGMTESQAQIVLLVGERGALSAPEIASRLGYSDPDVRADLRHLAASGRLLEVGGAWQLPVGFQSETGAAICRGLKAKADLWFSVGGR